MFFFGVSILAGILTVLAPCILPLLPVVVGSSEPGARRISRRALRVIGSLVVSVILFTLLLKATTLFIEIPSYAWAWFSGVVLVLLGITMVFPELWSKVSFVQKIAQSGNKTLGSGYTRGDAIGDFLMGFALGPVFSTCSPTYLFIIATVLPASFFVGLMYLFGFALGLALSLLLIAFFGQRIIDVVITRMDATHNVKRFFGILLIIVGIAIATGLDKKFEATILNSGYRATIDFEEKLIDKFSPKADDQTMYVKKSSERHPLYEELPRKLTSIFPQTDWSKIDARLALALHGGPDKDGIPALTDPSFESVQSFGRDESIESIVLMYDDEVKVYPYHMLVWHEIVNDVIGDVPVVVTFCPLCGSAIVYERTIDGRDTTFGVSGFLIENNMVMYDRTTESLWQQSTGVALAGTYQGKELKIFPMQRMTVGEAKKRYPHAIMLSEETGYDRAYGKNPYSGYEESNTFFFPVSREKGQYHPKTTVVVVPTNQYSVALVWDDIPQGDSVAMFTDDTVLTLTRNGSELLIKNADETVLPFYYEMWFSYVAQQGEHVTVASISKK